MYKFGFIGCGNMGGALAAAVSKTEKNIALADLSQSAAKKLASEIKAKISSNEEIAAKAEYIVLGVKPQVIDGVLADLAQILAGRKDKFTVISMAAGVGIERIEKALGSKTPIIRIMPNTPAAIGKGMIVYSVNKSVKKADKDGFLKGFSKAGEITEIPEKLIDAASAVSGCGPAFVYMFIQSLADGGVECGLPRDLALKLAAETVGGAAGMVEESGKHPEALKDAVCSPGGTTIAGVQRLEQGAFRGTVAAAVAAAYKKTLGL